MFSAADKSVNIPTSASRRLITQRQPAGKIKEWSTKWILSDIQVRKQSVFSVGVTFSQQTDTTETRYCVLTRCEDNELPSHSDFIINCRKDGQKPGSSLLISQKQRTTTGLLFWPTHCWFYSWRCFLHHMWTTVSLPEQVIPYKI